MLKHQMSLLKEFEVAAKSVAVSDDWNEGTYRRYYTQTPVWRVTHIINIFAVKCQLNITTAFEW